MCKVLDYRSDLFHRPIGDLFDVLGTGNDMTPATISLPVGRGWTDDALKLRIVMPAIGEKDSSLTVRGDNLILQGDRVALIENGRSVTYALPYGHFERIITLPPALELKRMVAKFHHSVPEVRIALQDDRKPIRIPVMSGAEGLEPGLASVASQEAMQIDAW